MLLSGTSLNHVPFELRKCLCVLSLAASGGCGRAIVSVTEQEIKAEVASEPRQATSFQMISQMQTHT